jgi:hypothetical protein
MERYRWFVRDLNSYHTPEVIVTRALEHISNLLAEIDDLKERVSEEAHTCCNE